MVKLKLRGEKMEESQCIYCETVYEVKESNSIFPNSCCSKECEDNYRRFLDELEFV
jgi:hypothetical protein